MDGINKVRRFCVLILTQANLHGSRGNLSAHMSEKDFRSSISILISSYHSTLLSMNNVFSHQRDDYRISMHEITKYSLKSAQLSNNVKSLR